MNGYYPPVVRHTCDNIKCINPEHLLAGDGSLNARDRHDRKRTANFVEDHHIEEIMKIRSEGMTYKQIAEKLGINWRRVEYVVQQKSRKAG